MGGWTQSERNELSAIMGLKAAGNRAPAVKERHVVLWVVLHSIRYTVSK